MPDPSGTSRMRTRRWTRSPSCCRPGSSGRRRSRPWCRSLSPPGGPGWHVRFANLQCSNELSQFSDHSQFSWLTYSDQLIDAKFLFRPYNFWFWPKFWFKYIAERFQLTVPFQLIEDFWQNRQFWPKVGRFCMRFGAQSMIFTPK